MAKAVAEEKEKKQAEGAAEEPKKEKVSLLSGKGFLIVGILLVLEALGGATVYYLGFRKTGPIEGVGGASFIESAKLKYTLGEEAPGGKSTVSVTMIFVLEVDPSKYDVVRREVEAFEPLLTSRVRDVVMGLSMDEIRAKKTEELLKAEILKIHNEELRKLSANANELGEEPIRRVLLKEYTVQ
ncbi:MAG: flagellar basal body-associated FliL family protein [Planctomycetes bacterium]|nr:flagellar basal body-associated FliL family protein [Planctomycetota bacterium]